MDDYYDKAVNILVDAQDKVALNRKIEQGVRDKSKTYLLVLSNYNHHDLNDIIIPDNVVGLIISEGELKTLKNIVLPKSLIRFDCSCNKIESIDGLILSDKLKYLNLSLNDLININTLHLPDSLIEINVKDNGIKNIDSLKLPPNLENFNIRNNMLFTITDIIIPSSIKTLDLGFDNIIVLINPQFNNVIRHRYHTNIDDKILKQTREQHIFLYLSSILSIDDTNRLLSLITTEK